MTKNNLLLYGNITLLICSYKDTNTSTLMNSITIALLTVILKGTKPIHKVIIVVFLFISKVIRSIRHLLQ